MKPSTPLLGSGRRLGYPRFASAVIGALMDGGEALLSLAAERFERHENQKPRAAAEPGRFRVVDARRALDAVLADVRGHLDRFLHDCGVAG